MAKELLTPLELVEVGRRLSKERAERLGLTSLIEDARLVVRRGIRILLASAEPLGVSDESLYGQGLRQALLGVSGWQAFSFASRDPRADTSIRGQHVGEEREVLVGQRKKGEPLRKAFVLDRGEVLVLGDANAGRVYRSLSAAAKAVGGAGPGFWRKAGRYERGERLGP